MPSINWPWKKKRPAPSAVFHVTTGDGNQHEVSAHSWVEWVALRSIEQRALPSQEDMRFMLRHMDDGATDGMIANLLNAAIPRVRRAAARGGIDLASIPEASRP